MFLRVYSHQIFAKKKARFGSLDGLQYRQDFGLSGSFCQVFVVQFACLSHEHAFQRLARQLPLCAF